MGYKIPKRVTGVVKTAVDPLGIGIGDAIFGANEGPDYSAQEEAKAKALADNQAATDAFVAGGASNYKTGGKLSWQKLGPAARQEDSELQRVGTDSRYKDAQLKSLRDLEEQSRDGFNASDRADMARTRNAVDAASRGRIGAIQQNMQARGATGSGLDMVAQMQSAQDATEIEAMRALETEANAQQRKSAASAAAGGLATDLQGNEFNQAAAKAEAQDRINQFNTQNSNQNSQYNNQGQNSFSQDNWNRKNTTADRNTSAAYDFRKDSLGAHQNQNSLNYNSATDAENQKRLDSAAAEQASAGKMGAILGVAGGVVGGIYGGPAGASAGAQVGGAAGQQVGSTQYRNSRYAHGGKVPGRAKHPGDDPRNDVVDALVSPEEIILPRSASSDPEKAAEFVAKMNGQDNEEDAIGLLLQAMKKLHEGKKQ